MSDDELVPYDLSVPAPGVPVTYVRVPPGWKLRNLVPRNGDPELSKWLRRRIAERLYLARRPIELGNAEEWTELSSGVLMTIAPDAPQDRRDGVHLLGDSSLTRLMEANDPRDTIARCDAELAILDEYVAAIRITDAIGAGLDDAARALDRAVRHLASGYSHWPGYKEEWNP